MSDRRSTHVQVVCDDGSHPKNRVVKVSRLRVEWVETSQGERTNWEADLLAGDESARQMRAADGSPAGPPRSVVEGLNRKGGPVSFNADDLVAFMSPDPGERRKPAPDTSQQQPQERRAPRPDEPRKRWRFQCPDCDRVVVLRDEQLINDKLIPLVGAGMDQINLNALGW